MTYEDQQIIMERIRRSQGKYRRREVARTEKQRRRRRNVGIVAMLLLLLIGGTFAWMSGTQRAINPWYFDVFNAGRIHDNFEPIWSTSGRGHMPGEHNKDVFAENFGTQSLFVRIRLFEFFAQDGIPLNPAWDIDDPMTWSLYLSAANDARVRRSDAVNNNLSEEIGERGIEWTMGGEKVFMPTFNHAVARPDMVHPSVPHLFAHNEVHRMTEATGSAIDWFALDFPIESDDRIVTITVTEDGFVHFEVDDDYVAVAIDDELAGNIILTLPDVIADPDSTSVGTILTDVTNADEIVVLIPSGWYYTILQHGTTGEFRVFVRYDAAPAVGAYLAPTGDYVPVVDRVAVPAPIDFFPAPPGSTDRYVPQQNRLFHARDYFFYGGQTGPGTDRSLFNTLDNGAHDNWSLGDTLTSERIYTYFNDDTNLIELRIEEATHTAQNTLSADHTGVMTIAQWNGLGRPEGNFWILDTDGWF